MSVAGVLALLRYRAWLPASGAMLMLVAACAQQPAELPPQAERDVPTSQGAFALVNGSLVALESVGAELERANSGGKHPANVELADGALAFAVHFDPAAPPAVTPVVSVFYFPQVRNRLTATEDGRPNPPEPMEGLWVVDFTAQRATTVSGPDRGVYWAELDRPLSPGRYLLSVVVPQLSASYYDFAIAGQVTSDSHCTDIVGSGDNARFLQPC